MRDRDGLTGLRRAWIGAGVALTMAAGGAPAQESMTDTDPLGVGEVGDLGSPGDDEPRLPSAGQDSPDVLPVIRGGARGVDPGLTGGSGWGDTADGDVARVLPEGTFLADRPGRIVDGPGGRKIFVPDRQGRQVGEGAMLMLPCATLEQIERAMALDPTIDGVTVSGQVTVFHGRNYLLTTRASRRAEASEAEPAEPSDSGDEPATTPDERADTPENSEHAAALQADPEVRALIEALEQRPRGPGATRIGSGHAPAETDAMGNVGRTGVSSAMAEGTALLRRRGRLIRDADGGWILHFDNGTTTSRGDAPLGVLPCRLLMAMEDRVDREGENLDMLVSGRVYSYKGRGYLLPTLMQLMPRSGVDPLQ